MASISLPLQPQTTSALPHYFDTADRAPNRHRRNQTMSTPLPNPPFVFPARDPNDAEHQEPAPMANERPQLPAFSFNPGSADSSQPPAPAPAPAPPTNRMSGHRRQYSEFVGGDQMVAPEDTAAGQTKEEESTGPAKLPAPGPGFSGGGRRRHAHRRSAAISSVDLTAISNALDLKPKPESAPCTPADLARERRPSHEPPVPPLPHSASGVYRSTQPASPQLTVDAARPSSQAQADQEWSSSCLSSEASPNILETPLSTQPDTPPNKSDTAISFSRMESPTGPQRSRPRPKTADASLLFEMSGNITTDHSSPTKRPSSAAGHSRTHKSLSSGLLTAAFRKSHVEDDGFFPPSRQSSDDDSDNADEANDMSGSPSSLKKRSKSKKRQKKVRSWAGSLLIRGKGKSQDSKKDDSESEPKQPRPPALVRTNSDFGSGLDVAFDDDNIVVLRTPTNPTHPESQHSPTEPESYASLEESWKPRSFYEQTTNTAPDAMMSPIIDLDAALGPFKTPDLRNDNPPESGFSAATKRMYSGGRRGEFVGPEMRYHRRAESAPEMPPFDRAFLGSHRFPTSSSLENPDVFYEEEEDAFLAATSESGNDNEDDDQATSDPKGSDSKDDKSENSGDSSDTLTGRATTETARPTNTGLGIREPDAGISSSAPAASHDLFRPSEHRFYSSQAPTLSSPFSGRPKTPLEIGKPGEWQSRIPYPPSPEVSPRFLPADHRPMTSPTELSGMPPFSLHGGCSLPNSSFPSPDFTVSSEAPRSITTSSTDPFPHASIEDVPSLTSSASTMTNTLNRVSQTFFARPRLSTDRSASLSAAVHRRSSQPSSKRSSLASLSKLMVGPHAERSKLSHEEKPPGDEPERSKKKGRRISRLMHFWKLKDKEKPNEPSAQD